MWNSSLGGFVCPATIDVWVRGQMTEGEEGVRVRGRSQF
jgi:hypothetical protein